MHASLKRSAQAHGNAARSHRRDVHQVGNVVARVFVELLDDGSLFVDFRLCFGKALLVLLSLVTKSRFGSIEFLPQGRIFTVDFISLAF